MAKYSLINVSLLLILLLTSTCLADKTIKWNGERNQQDVVQTKIVGFTPPSEVVVQSLAKAIKSDLKSKRFRVSGAYSMGGGSGDVTVLYNRPDATIKYFALDYSMGKAFVRSHIYTNVSDELIYKLSEALSSADGTEDMKGRRASGAYYFDELITYGSKRIEDPRYK